MMDDNRLTYFDESGIGRPGSMCERGCETVSHRLVAAAGSIAQERTHGASALSAQVHGLGLYFRRTHRHPCTMTGGIVPFVKKKYRPFTVLFIPKTRGIRSGGVGSGWPHHPIPNGPTSQPLELPSQNLKKNWCFGGLKAG